MSNQYTQAITSFNGLNQTDNTNSSFISIGNNMDSQHYPYLATMSYKHTGVETEEILDVVDIAEIFGDTYKVLGANYDGKYVELLQKGDVTIPYTMNITDYRGEHVKGNRFVKCGTTWLVNNILSIENYIKGGIKTYDYLNMLIPSYFTPKTKQIGGKTYIGVRVAESGNGETAILNLKPLTHKCCTPFICTYRKIEFVYAYENLAYPSSLTDEELDKCVAFIQNCTYTNAKKVLMTNEQTVPSWIDSQEFITYYQYKNDATYGNYNIYIGSRDDKGLANHTFDFNYLVLEKGYVELNNLGEFEEHDIPQDRKHLYMGEVTANSTNLYNTSVDGTNILEYYFIQFGYMKPNTAFGIQGVINKMFQVGDFVMISEYDGTDLSANVSKNIIGAIIEKNDNEIYFNIESSVFPLVNNKMYSFSRINLKFDFYSSHKNRIYAYSNKDGDILNRLWDGEVIENYTVVDSHNIYVSSLGYPTQFKSYDTLIDSYTVVDSDQSNASALVEYNDMVLLFKEKAIEKIIGDLPSNYQTYVYDFCGPISGFDTVCKINERLYYLGSDLNVYMYSGGEPQIISSQLNEFMPNYSISDGEWNNNTKINRNYFDYKDIEYAYGFQYDGSYYLSIKAKATTIKQNGNVSQRVTCDIPITLKYDQLRNQWFPISKELYSKFISNSEGKYTYSFLEDNIVHSVDTQDLETPMVRINPNFYAILAPTNMGNMRLKHFKKMRVRFECTTNEPSDRINVGYAIDNERILHTSKMPINERTVLEIPIDKIGEEITIGFEGNGIIVIKGIEIDYEVLENIR